MELSSASFAYPDTGGAKRADLARRLRLEAAGADTFVLATCLRLEVVVNGDLDVLGEALERLFDGSAHIADARIRCGQDAVLYLYRLVAGLESPIVGEVEVLTQYRTSLHQAHERGCISGLFLKLLQEAIPAGRKAREVLPDSPHASLAAIAAQAVGAADRVAVLGSGVMAMSVVRALAELPSPPRVTVVARSPEKVPHEGIQVLPFTAAAELLRDFPAIVSATSAQHRPIDDMDVARALEARTEHGILVDMAMPPDFRIPCRRLLRYLDIDDLAAMAGRRPRDDRAGEMVAHAARRAYEYGCRHADLAPTLAALTRLADDVVADTAARFGGRLHHADDADVLQRALHHVARRLLSGPMRHVRDADSSVVAPDVLGVVFGVGVGVGVDDGGPVNR